MHSMDANEHLYLTSLIYSHSECYDDYTKMTPLKRQEEKVNKHLTHLDVYIYFP